MIRVAFSSLSIILLFFTSAWAGPMFNYQGRIQSGGENYNGPGYVKVVLINGFTNGVWSNDGVPASNGTNEPINAITTTVSSGLFNLNVGATFDGFTEIPAVEFHQGNLFLRTWFSTNNAVFEQLSPDGNIVPKTLADIDTADLVYVSGRGSADFDDIQEAIDYAGSNFASVVILPGGYEISAPLTTPTNTQVAVQGVSRDLVTIFNTNGGAVLEADWISLEDVTLVGDPAVTDSGTSGNHNIHIRSCRLQRATPGGPALELVKSGHFSLVDTDVSNDQGGPAAALGGTVQFTARSCDFRTYGGGSDAVEFSGTNNVVLSTCEINSETGLSLKVEPGQPRIRIVGSEIRGNVEISGSDSSLEVNTCNVSGNSNGVAAVHVLNSDAQLQFLNCDITGQDVTAVQVTATAGNSSSFSLRQSRVVVYSNTGATNIPAVLVTNATANDVESAECELISSEVSANNGSAVVVVNGFFEASESTLEGSTDGVAASGGEVDIRSSFLEAEESALRIEDGTMLRMYGSEMFTEGEDVSLVQVSDDSQLILVRSAIFAEGAGSIGVEAAAVGASVPVGRIVSCNISASGPALDLTGGDYVITDSVLESFSTNNVILRNEGSMPTATFNNTIFFREAFAANPLPGLVLHAPGGGTNAPTPTIVRSTFSLPGAASTVDVGGGITTGAVKMVGSALSTNVAASITVQPPVSLGGGNFRY